MISNTNAILVAYSVDKLEVNCVALDGRLKRNKTSILSLYDFEYKRDRRCLLG